MASHRLETHGAQDFRHTSQSARASSGIFIPDRGITMLRFMGRILAAGLFLFAGASHAQVVVSQVYGAGGNTGATFKSGFPLTAPNSLTKVGSYSSAPGLTDGIFARIFVQL